MKKPVLIFILFFLLNNSLYSQKQGPALIDSLKKAVAQSKEDTNMVNLLNRIAEELSGINPNEGLKYGDTALALSEVLQYNRGITRAYNTKGLNLVSKSNYSGALEAHFKALKIAEELNDKEAEARSFGNIGVVYDIQSDYTQALDYYQKALKTFNELKDSAMIAVLLGNIGTLYIAQNNYPAALVYLGKAFKYVEQEKDTNGMAMCIGNIGNIYLYELNYKEAADKNELALVLNKKTGNQNGIGINFLNLGEIYYRIARDNNLGFLQSMFNGNKKSALKKSFDCLNEAIVIFKEIGFLNGLQEAYKQLSNACEVAGDYAGSLHAFRNHVAYKDSIFNSDNRKKIVQLENERKDDLKEKEIEIQRLLLLKSQNERWYFISGFAGLILLLLVVLNRFRVKKRSNEKLEKAYNDLKSTQQQLVQQEKLASLGALTAGIAHEIKNPLNFVNNFSELSAEQMDELIATNDPDEKNEIAKSIRDNLDKISKHGRRADSIVQGMLQHARTGDSISESTDINKLCNEIADLAFQGMKAHTPDFNAEIIREFTPGLPKIKTVSQDISRVLVNLLNNAFYAVNEKSNAQKKPGRTEKYKPKVTITTMTDEKNILINVEDNGMGIPEIIKEKIFEPFFTTKPTGQGTGLGLSICYDIIKSHGGELKVESTENVSTAFIISLPV